MRYRTVIFDLDGTLTDSGEGIIQSAICAMRQMGLPIPPREKLELMRGPSLKWSFTTLFGLTEEQAYEAIRIYRRYYKTVGLQYNGMFDGALAMLEKLTASGIRVYVASAKYQRHARMVCRKMGISQRICGVYGSGNPKKGAGKEVILARILNKRGVQQPAVMIGDKDMDVRAGKACGIDTIGVSYGYAAQGELEAAQPTTIISSIEQLCQYLLQE
jgi:phosphoglycolate phosphatase